MVSGSRGMIFFGLIILIFSACPGMPVPAEKEHESIIRESDAQTVSTAQTLTEAVLLTSRIISESLDPGISIAIISVNADDSFEGEYALEELTFNLVRTHKFRIVDRHNLDVIRAEQHFHYSGEVSDETAVSIGQLTGAAFVITGSISARESANYFRIRVLDVQTGQIHVMSSILYGGA